MNVNTMAVWLAVIGGFGGGFYMFGTLSERLDNTRTEVVSMKSERLSAAALVDERLRSVETSVMASTFEMKSTREEMRNLAETLRPLADKAERFEKRAR